MTQYNDQIYTIRRKMFQLAGGKFHIYDSTGEMILFCKQKAFKLKEDIRLYSDESMSDEILTMHARSSIDFSAIYDVIDSQSGEKIGAFQRNGMKSIFKDEWIVMNAYEEQIGLIKEDSRTMAFLRRFLSNLIPQNFDFVINGEKKMDLRQHFNPFIYKLDLDFSFDPESSIDKRMGLAAGILITAIEGRQN